MEDKYKEFLSRNALNLLNEIPIACHLLVDKKGSWNIRDFERVWANKASEALFPRVNPRSFAARFEQNKINSMQAFWNQVKRSIEDGASGFIGPFSNHYIKSDMSLIIIESYILYLGKTEDGYPAFFTVIHEKTEEMYQSKIAKISDSKANGSAWKMMSNRERHVAKLICEGLITKEIADKLGVSKRTIDNHRSNIRKKFNLPRNTTLAEYLGISPAQ